RVAEALSDQVFFLSQRETSSREVAPLIAEALRIHDLHRDRTSLARALLHQRAAAFFEDVSLPAAQDHSMRSVEIYRNHYPADREFPQALTALAIVLLRQGQRERALVLQEEALDL